MLCISPCNGYGWDLIQASAFLWRQASLISGSGRPPRTQYISNYPGHQTDGSALNRIRRHIPAIWPDFTLHKAILGWIGIDNATCGACKLGSLDFQRPISLCAVVPDQHDCTLQRDATILQLLEIFARAKVCVDQWSGHISSLRMTMKHICLLPWRIVISQLLLNHGLPSQVWWFNDSNLSSTLPRIVQINVKSLHVYVFQF